MIEVVLEALRDVAGEQPGGEQCFDCFSDGYQRAVSDVVEALREARATVPVVRVEGRGESTNSGSPYPAADFIERRFAPTSEGKE